LFTKKEGFSFSYSGNRFKWTDAINIENKFGMIKQIPQKGNFHHTRLKPLQLINRQTDVIILNSASIETFDFKPFIERLRKRKNRVLNSDTKEHSI
jgi:hypothetical protein